jgi:hypothetical protein
MSSDLPSALPLFIPSAIPSALPSALPSVLPIAIATLSRFAKYFDFCNYSAENYN